MDHRFRHHYTRDQARQLLPHVRDCLTRMRALREQLRHAEQRLAGLMADGDDLGGAPVNEKVRALADLGEILRDLAAREILIKDLDRGLVDFPALLDGREVFLCWEEDEADVEHWHDLDTGFAGRERL